MKRSALALAAALLGTGCISSNTTTYVPPPETGAVDLGWSFIRYNAAGSPIATYGCTEAVPGLGTVTVVDSVVVSFQRDGDVTVSCADNAGDGAMITGISAGTQSVTITGRRGGHALFQSQPLTITVAVNQTTAAGTVHVLGIPGDLAIYAHFLDQFGNSAGWTTCQLANVATLDYVIADGVNTTVESGTINCADPAGVSFLNPNGLDRDQYVIRMRGFASGASVESFDSATTAVAPTCSGQAFNHYGASDAWDVDLFDVTHNLTVCP